jgi:pimeloyl-ACP methyl ester carboxylesterase
MRCESARVHACEGCWCKGARCVVVVLAVLLSARTVWGQTVTRQDWTVNGAPGVQLFVREVVPRGKADASLPPVLLVHGARVASVGSFDLPVPNGSLAEDLAAAGLRVYMVDVRGYGRSTRPARMNEPPAPGAPLARSSEAIEDIEFAVAWVQTRTGAPKVSLLGWATGAHWAGLYATRYPAKVSALVLDSMIYGGGSNHPMFGKGSDLEDPKRPGTFNRAIGAYRFNDAASLLRQWDASIPVADKNPWRDPAVAAAYVKEAMTSDPTSGTRTPPSFRSPSGALADAFEVASGRQAWDAGLIQCRTLVIAGERDFWSRAEDRDRLKAHLVNAGEVQVVAIPNATHHVHLDRPERGRKTFVEAVVKFLKTPAPKPASPQTPARIRSKAADGGRTVDWSEASGG